MILFLILASIFLILIVFKSKKISTSIQKYYIKKSKSYNTSIEWDKVWIRIMFQIGVIFATIVFLAMFFSVIFPG